MTISIGMFLGGINIGVVFNISEWILITGIAVGTFIMSNPLSVFKQLFEEIPKIIDEKPYNKTDYLELLSFLYNFLKHANTISHNELEGEIDKPYQSSLFIKYPALLKRKDALSFFQNHFRLVTLGFQDVEVIEEMMFSEIDSRHNHSLKVVHALNKLADALPALGIVAAVLGVIGAMSSVGSAPAILGARVAGALIGTFAGVFLAYCIVSPIASFLEKFNDEERTFLECMQVAMLSYMKGHPVSIAIEFARQTIKPDSQPAFHEVEEIIFSKR
jgi:chemotaxis protein MotA